MNRMVNEQIEIGILIALMGLLTASVFAPLAIRILYTPEFLPSAVLLQWFLLGIFGRVVGWPMGMLVLAKGHSKTFAVLQSISVPIHLGWILLFFHYFGLEGTAMAFALHNIIYVPALLMFLRKRYALYWTNEVSRLLLFSTGAFCLTQGLRFFLNESIAFYLSSVVILIAAGWFCLRGLVLRVGDNPKIKRLLSRLPKLLRRLVS